MACVFFCSLQICKHTTLFWHYRQSTALWKQYIPVPGHLWSSHHLSPMSRTCRTESQGPSTNADVFLVPGGSFHFGQHVCAPRWEESGLWGKEGSFPHPSGTVIGHPCLKLGLKKGSYFELSIPPKQSDDLWDFLLIFLWEKNRGQWRANKASSSDHGSVYKLVAFIPDYLPREHLFSCPLSIHTLNNKYGGRPEALHLYPRWRSLISQYDHPFFRPLC